MKRLPSIMGFVFIVSLALLIKSLLAETYPIQPIQLVTTGAPGDAQDITARTIASELSKDLKTSVIPLNKTGGAGSVGTDFVAKGKKDGYTILYTNSNIIYAYAMNPENIPYHPLQDLEPLCMANSNPLLISVLADSPWKSLQDLVDYIQKSPGKVRGFSTGVGSVGHFGYEVIRSETGAAITMVPYKGASPGFTAFLGGHLEVGIPAFSLVSPHLKTGKVRAILTSKKIPEFPDIPTLIQLGYKRDMPSVWHAFFVPAGVPDSVKKVLSSALEKSIKSKDVINVIRQLGAVEDYKPAGDLKKAMIEEFEMAKALLKTTEASGK